MKTTQNIDYQHVENRSISCSIHGKVKSCQHPYEVGTAETEEGSKSIFKSLSINNNAIAIDDAYQGCLVHIYNICQYHVAKGNMRHKNSAAREFGRVYYSWVFGVDNAPRFQLEYITPLNI